MRPTAAAHPYSGATPRLRATAAALAPAAGAAERHAAISTEIRRRKPSPRERPGDSGIAPLEFSDVYDAHVEQVYGFFFYRLRSAADIEDLTQQTFERALGAWGRYDPARASLATWLLVIARNLLADHLRSAHRNRERSLDALGERHAPIGGTHDRYEIGVSCELERALAQLSDRERELIALRFGGDLSCPEIATMTGLTLANVQQILSRSLRGMRASLRPVRRDVPTARAAK